jgi:hypothetical protein
VPTNAIRVSFPGRPDDVLGDGGQLADIQHAFDLGG